MKKIVAIRLHNFSSIDSSPDTSSAEMMMILKNDLSINKKRDALKPKLKIVPT